MVWPTGGASGTSIAVGCSMGSDSGWFSGTSGLPEFPRLPVGALSWYVWPGGFWGIPTLLVIGSVEARSICWASSAILSAPNWISASRPKKANSSQIAWVHFKSSMAESRRPSAAACRFPASWRSRLT